MWPSGAGTRHHREAGPSPTTSGLRPQPRDAPARAHPASPRMHWHAGRGLSGEAFPQARPRTGPPDAVPASAPRDVAGADSRVAFLAQRGAAPTPPSSDKSTPTPVRFRRLTDEMGRCLIVKRERGHFKCRLPGKTPSLCQNPQSRGTWCRRALGQTRKHTLLSEKGRCTRHTRGRE